MCSPEHARLRGLQQTLRRAFLQRLTVPAPSLQAPVVPADMCKQHVYEPLIEQETCPPLAGRLCCYTASL